MRVPDIPNERLEYGTPPPATPRELELEVKEIFPLALTFSFVFELELQLDQEI
jgi:hypothetical protein